MDIVNIIDVHLKTLSHNVSEAVRIISRYHA